MAATMSAPPKSETKRSNDHEHNFTEVVAPGVVDETPDGFIGNAKAFFQKFGNDWSMNLAGMLAYNLLTTIFPLFLGIIGIAGLLLGSFGVRERVINYLNNLLPEAARSQVNLPELVSNINQGSGIVAIIGLIGLIWGGSNLFVSMEAAMNVIFRSHSRPFLKQRLVAVGMVLLFTVLVVVFVVASSLPGWAGSLAQGLDIPGLGIVLGLLGPLIAVLSVFVLFLAIYAIVPNMKIGLHHAWRGALIAALLVTVVTLGFPLYTSLVVKPDRYGSFVGFAILIVLWFWLFSVILLLGAQINSYFGLGQRAAPGDLPMVLHMVQVHGELPSAAEDADSPPEGHPARPEPPVKEENRSDRDPQGVVPPGGDSGRILSSHDLALPEHQQDKAPAREPNGKDHNAATSPSAQAHFQYAGQHTHRPNNPKLLMPAAKPKPRQPNYVRGGIIVASLAAVGALIGIAKGRK